MTETEKAWLACAIDGEGYIHIANRIDPRTKWRIRKVMLGVVNTDTRFVQEAARLMGAGRLSVQDRAGCAIANTSYAGRKTVYQARITDRHRVLAVLLEIRPYLIIKRDKADQAVEFIELTPWKTHTAATRAAKSVKMREVWATGKRSHKNKNARQVDMEWRKK